jgi:dienelactone hydrolase
MATADFRDQLRQGLGGAWPEPCALNVRIRSREQQEGFSIESVYYDAEPETPVPALLLVPEGVSTAHRAPGIAVWHQHAGEFQLGKSEPAGLAGNAMHHTGAALAREGYVVLCPDALCFEERQDPDQKLKGMRYERFEFLRYVVDGKCLAWKNILDMKRAIDFLTSRPEVQTDRVGCYGHSMGSTHGWLIGPWDERLKAVVGNCCLPTYRGIHREKMLHCFPNFVPGLQQHGDTPDIAALIAPRALHLSFGELDRGTPIEDVADSVNTIARSYASMHAADKFTYYVEPETGHVLSEEMWRRTKSVFEKHLRV